MLKKIDEDSYLRFFAPRAAAGLGPSGLADPPRPFVFRMRGPLEVGMNLFITTEPTVELFTRVMGELGGLSSVEGKERLQFAAAVRSLSAWLNDYEQCSRVTPRS